MHRIFHPSLPQGFDVLSQNWPARNNTDNMQLRKLPVWQANPHMNKLNEFSQKAKFGWPIGCSVKSLGVKYFTLLTKLTSDLKLVLC